MAIWKQDQSVPVADEISETHTLPASSYTDPDVLKREFEQIFSQSWQFVGDSREIPDQGDYITREVGNESLIISRGKDGEVRAFYNVCAHRGSRIVDGDGNTRMFQCPYHAWTYSLDGEFTNAPNFDEDSLDCDANSLLSVEVESLGPLLFVSLEENPKPLHDLLGELPEILDQYDIESFEPVRTIEYDIKSNWKVYVENYLECDHCPVNHPSLMETLDMSEYTIEPHEYHVSQYGTINDSGKGYAAENDRVADEVKNLFRYVWIWPNVMLNVGPNSLSTARVKPVDHENTKVIVQYYTRDGTESEALEDRIEMGEQVMQEDIELCERQFKGLQSNAFKQGRLANSEHGVHRFDLLVQDALDLETAE